MCGEVLKKCLETPRVVYNRHAASRRESLGQLR